MSSTLIHHHPLVIGHVITLLAVNLNVLQPEHTDLSPTCEPTPLDLRALDDMGLLRKVGSIFCISLAGPVVPRHERVFGRNTTTRETDQQATQQLAAAEQNAAARLDRIEARMAHMKNMLQLLVQHLLPAEHRGT